MSRRLRIDSDRKRIVSGRKTSAVICGVSSQVITKKSRRASQKLLNENAPSGTTSCVGVVSEYASPEIKLQPGARVSSHAIRNSVTGTKEYDNAVMRWNARACGMPHSADQAAVKPGTSGA